MVQLMPKRKHTYGVDSPVEVKNQPAIPRWRQIEIMKERAQLREALGDPELDLDLDFEEYELEVFGSDEENEAIHQHNDVADPEDIELLEADPDADDFDDFADD